MEPDRERRPMPSGAAGASPLVFFSVSVSSMRSGNRPNWLRRGDSCVPNQSATAHSLTSTEGLTGLCCLHDLFVFVLRDPFSLKKKKGMEVSTKKKLCAAIIVTLVAFSFFHVFSSRQVVSSLDKIKRALDLHIPSPVRGAAYDTFLDESLHSSSARRGFYRKLA